MAEKPIKEPGPDHPITIDPNPRRIVVSVAGRVIADTSDALTLREADYAPVEYIPLKDVERSLLETSEQTSYCPYKGDCSYYSIVGDDRLTDAVWEYKAPYGPVAQIKDRVAFYRDRVEITVS